MNTCTYSKQDMYGLYRMYPVDKANAIIQKCPLYEPVFENQNE